MIRFRFLLFQLCLTILPFLVKAQIAGQRYVLITIRTGGDDLRAGQSATADIHFKNRKAWLGHDLNEGQGWGNNTTHTYEIPFYDNLLPSDFKSLTLKYNGSSTQAFQDYDNWNIDQVKVEVITPNQQPRRTLLLDARGQPVVRFTGDYRQISWNFLPVNDPAASSAPMASDKVRVVRWISPVTGDFETLREDLNPDSQLIGWGYKSKLYQFSAFKTPPDGSNVTAVNRWVMPKCAASIVIAEHEISDATLQSWGYTNKQFLFYAYRTKPATGNYTAVYRWINAKPQGDPCRDFTLTVAATELTDEQLRSWGYSDKRLQYWVPRE